MKGRDEGLYRRWRDGFLRTLSNRSYRRHELITILTINRRARSIESPIDCRTVGMISSGVSLVLVSRDQTRLHFGFAVLAFALAAAGVGWWISESVAFGAPVGGGSASGLACGIAAGLVIVFEMLLWPRKLLRRLRLIPAKYWMAAHVWFGLASLPLAIAHSGLHWGGWLPTSLMVLFVATILSGIYGLALQNVIPRWMLWNLPAETIYNQIDYVSQLTVEDARRMLVACCGRRPGTGQNLELDAEPELISASSESIVIGAVRGSGKTLGRSLMTGKVTPVLGDSGPLWNAFDEIRPFLMEGQKASTPVTLKPRSKAWFESLRASCGPESQSIIDTLESFCDQRRQFDIQQTCQRWLHGWLPIHIAASVAVSVLLVVHIYTALKYW